MRSHKKFLAIISSLLITMFSSCASGQSIKNATTDTFKVEGNCGMCEKTIETAANKKGVVKADWNKDSKLLVVTFDNKKTNSDQILKRVAYAGYDNEKYKGDDKAYTELAGCCQYERK